MKLSEWLRTEEGKRRHTQGEFGRMVELTQGRISQIVRNGTTDLRTALKIEAATDRQVTVADLLMEPGAGSGKTSPANQQAAE